MGGAEQFSNAFCSHQYSEGPITSNTAAQPPSSQDSGFFISQQGFLLVHSAKFVLDIWFQQRQVSVSFIACSEADDIYRL